jgi:hypothetical protein
MRRALSILLMLFIGLGPLAATLQGSNDARLPICCRRNGSHHCAMSEESLARVIQTVSGRTPVIGAPAHCPVYPGTAAATVSPVQALAASGITSPALPAQAHEQLPLQFAVFGCETRPHSVRGPPASFFA